MSKLVEFVLKFITGLVAVNLRHHDHLGAAEVALLDVSARAPDVQMLKTQSVKSKQRRTSFKLFRSPELLLADLRHVLEHLVAHVLDRHEHWHAPTRHHAVAAWFKVVKENNKKKDINIRQKEIIKYNKASFVYHIDFQ